VLVLEPVLELVPGLGLELVLGLVPHRQPPSS
jgi:hypothetical protein